MEKRKFRRDISTFVKGKKMKIEWAYCFFQIILKQIKIFFKIFKSKLTDLFIFTFTTATVFGYIMPKLGVGNQYGPFILVGLVPLISFFEAIQQSTILISDMETTKKISYLLTLPMPSSITILSIGISWAICNMIYSFWIIPIGMVFFFKYFHLFKISIFKFLVIFLSFSTFFGIFSLWLSSIVKSMKYVSLIWARVANPLFMFGGYFYYWHSLFDISKFFGFLNLLNPVLYAMEGIRGALLANTKTINFWICCLVLWSYTFFLGYFAVKILKRRLDAV